MAEKETDIDDTLSQENDGDPLAEIDPFPKTDVTFLVEGKEIHACIRILKLVSPVFRAMFELDFKEKYQERIELPDKSHKAMVEFLKCTYPFINAPISVNNVLLILPLADEYQTELKVRCEEFLMNLFRGNIDYFVHRTDKYDVKKIEGISYVSDERLADAESLDCFKSPGFGKQGFSVGNTVPPKDVISYVIAAEKYQLSRLLIISTQYMAMRMFSHYETFPRFSEISADTRMNTTMLRLRHIEHSIADRKLDDWSKIYKIKELNRKE